MSNPEVNIYSDWWANPNPGRAWYWFILEYKWLKKEFSEWFEISTNNRMELMWVINWLSKITKKSKINIYTDSQYTINGIQKWWAQKWKENNWIKSNKQKAINYDLWEQLLDLVNKHEVKFHWVKWHNGHNENERCDELATLAMDFENLKKDDFYISEYYSKNTAMLSTHDSQILPNLPLSREEQEKKQYILNTLWKWDPNIKISREWDPCRKCWTPVTKKIPKHTKKTLQKKFYYKYYFTCQYCKTNYMTNDAKDDVKNLKI